MSGTGEAAGGGTKRRSRFRVTSLVEAAAPAASAFEDDYMAPISVPTSTTSKVPQALAMPKRKITELMEETREAGLEMPIPSSNKGFQLLKKLGFGEKQGLGKDETGIKDPLPMVVRSFRDTSGIGIVDERPVRREAERASKVARAEQFDQRQSSFRKGISSSYSQAQLERDIRGAQKVIYELDISDNVPAHRLSQFMHTRYSPDGRVPGEGQLERSSRQHVLDTMDGQDGSGDDEDRGAAVAVHLTESKEDERLDAELLRECLEYLQGRHNYCFYCAVRYDDEDDLASNCPGLLRDDH